MGYGAMRSLPASEEDDCASLSPINSSAFKSRSSHSGHSLPEEIVAEILLRLPAKSVARFRCVSTTWLSIATDPSFILAHARRARNSLLFLSFSKFKRPFGPSYNKLFSFSARDFSCAQLSREQIFDEARSSCNGLVLFLRWDKQPPSPQHYLMNPLTGMIIDIPDPYKCKDSLMELYYHRWTGEYRLLYFREYINFITGETKRLDAEVLSLAGACPSPSWRQIKAKVPTVSLFYNQSRILVNDRLYWMGQDFSQAHTILVFDILKETFSLMEPPSYGRNALPPFADSSCSKFGFVDIAGTLCFWVVYRDKSCMENVTIHVWAAVDGDEKWKNTYSLCYNDEWLWAFLNPFNTELSLDCCLCVRESELLFLFDGRRNRMKSNRLAGQDVQYFFHWDLKSGKYWTEPLPAVICVQLSSGIVHKETLVTAPFLSTAAITRFLP